MPVCCGEELVHLDHLIWLRGGFYLVRLMIFEVLFLLFSKFFLIVLLKQENYLINFLVFSRLNIEK